MLVLKLEIEGGGGKFGISAPIYLMVLSLDHVTHILLPVAMVMACSSGVSSAACERWWLVGMLALMVAGSASTRFIAVHVLLSSMILVLDLVVKQAVALLLWAGLLRWAKPSPMLLVAVGLRNVLTGRQAPAGANMAP